MAEINASKYIRNFMKKTQIILACALALALAGITVLHAAEEGRKEGKASVRSVRGKVEYNDHGNWVPLKPNMKFASGVSIRTGPKGVTDISVNGLSSAVRITNATTLEIKEMSYVGSAREGDTTTMLNLLSGTVLGNVKKISANSRYEITTPHGVAGIRGTDWLVSAVPTEDGKYVVTFSSVSGIVTASAIVDGKIQTHTLTSLTSWQVGENVKPMNPQDAQNLFNGLGTEFTPVPPPPAPPPIPTTIQPQGPPAS
jgi:hypothetical protein